MTIQLKVMVGLAVLACSFLFLGCNTLPTNGNFPTTILKKQLDSFELPIDPPRPQEIERFFQCMAPFTAQLNDRFSGLINEGLSNASSPLGLRSFRMLSENIAETVQLDLIALKSNPRKTTTHNFTILFDKLATEVLIPGNKDVFKEKLREANEKYKQIKGDFNSSGDRLSKAADRSKSYLKAYFGTGPKTSFVDPETKRNLQSIIASRFKIDSDDSRVADLLDAVIAEMQKQSAVSDVAVMQSPGFVARDGTKYGFPGIFGGNAGASIDHSQIGADVIRILLEALRDSYAPLPVVGNSTAATLAVDGDVDIFESGLVSDDEEVTGVWHIDGTLEYPYSLKPSKFQAFESDARSTEASVAEAVGKAIRGGSSGALNNEALAKFIETAAGVIARHSTERAQWCLSFSQNTQNPGE